MTMKTSNYWFVDRTWLKQYASNRIIATGKDPRLTEIESRSELFERLMAERGSILDVGIDSATVKIHGAITEQGPDLYDLLYGYGGLSYAELNQAVEEADMMLSEGKTIYLDIDTPGGDASGTEDSYSLIREVAQSRPVIGFVTGTMASAGVWIGSACTELHAMGNLKVIGSVGVATTIVDWSELSANCGIHVYDLTNKESGDKRPDYSTEEGRDVVVKLLDEFYELFIGAVIEGRAGKTTREKVEELKGAVVLSQKALKTGFIDSILKPSFNGNNSAASAETTNEKEEKMKLSEFLAQNPEAAKEIEQIKADAKSEGKKEGAQEERDAIGARHEKLSSFMDGDYPQAVKKACVEGVIGVKSMDGVMDFIAYVDKDKETKKAEASEKEQKELKATPPQEPAKVESEKKQREVDSRVSSIASLLG